jgi:Aerolysin toxin
MANIDAKIELEKILATKAFIGVSATRKVKKTKMGYARGGHGDPGEPFEITYYVDEQYISSVPATIVSTHIEKIDSLVFGTVSTTGLPENIHLSKKLVENNSDATVSSSISMTVGATESWSVTKSTGISTTLGASLDLSYSLNGAGVRTAFSFSQTISSSTSTSEGNQKQITRSTTDSVSIGPRKSIQIELMVYESPAEIPFKAIVIVDAEIIANQSGVILASQLLSKDERTFSIEGILKITPVSEGYLRVTDVGLTKQENGEQDNISQIDSSVSFTGALTNEYASQFKKHSKISRNQNGTMVAENLSLSNLKKFDAGPVIGPPDGVRYTVISTTKEYRPTPSCGFNDIGVMNLGVFEVETREYSNWNNGTLISTWTERVESFLSCWMV